VCACVCVCLSVCLLMQQSCLPARPWIDRPEWSRTRNRPTCLLYPKPPLPLQEYATNVAALVDAKLEKAKNYAEQVGACACTYVVLCRGRWVCVRLLCCVVGQGVSCRVAGPAVSRHARGCALRFVRRG